MEICSIRPVQMNIEVTKDYKWIPSPGNEDNWPSSSSRKVWTQKRRRQRNLAHLRPICTSSSLPSLSLWASGIVSLLSTKQILFPLLLPKLHLTFWAWLRPGFVQKTQQPLLCSLTTSPSLTPPVRLGRAEVLIFSFLTFGNSPLILPYAIITHWNLMLLL